jgi:hypothetical protein
LRWAEACDALEQAAKEGRVFIPDFGGNAVYAVAGGFEHLLGLLDADRLHIVDRGIAGRLGKAPLEGAFRQARLRHHFRHRICLRVVVGNPGLALRDDGIVVLARARHRGKGQLSPTAVADQEDL